MFSDVFRKNSFFCRTAFVQTTKKNIMIGQRQYCPIKRRRCATTWPDQTCFATVRFGKKNFTRTTAIQDLWEERQKKKYHMEDVGTLTVTVFFVPKQPWMSISFFSFTRGSCQMSQEYLQLVTWNDFGPLETMRIWSWHHAKIHSAWWCQKYIGIFFPAEGMLKVEMMVFFWGGSAV